jgi:uncharacterized membrane protein
MIKLKCENDVIAILNLLEFKMSLSKHSRGVIYMVGCAFIELLFTASRRWPRLDGHTQLWVLPLYYFGSIYAFEPLYRRFCCYHRLVRLFVYAATFLGIEFVAGWILDKYLGQCPWEYQNRRFSVYGYVDLAYAPLWAVLGLMGEIVYAELSRYHRIPSNPVLSQPGNIRMLECMHH